MCRPTVAGRRFQLPYVKVLRFAEGLIRDDASALLRSKPWRTLGFGVVAFGPLLEDA